MNAKKAKYLRRLLKPSIEKGSYSAWVAHPELYTNVRNETMLKYKMQYVVQGGISLVKAAKKLYKKYGKLPR